LVAQAMNERNLALMYPRLVGVALMHGRGQLLVCSKQLYKDIMHAARAHLTCLVLLATRLATRLVLLASE
jgi:hypothetical protein